MKAEPRTSQDTLAVLVEHLVIIVAKFNLNLSRTLGKKNLTDSNLTLLHTTTTHLLPTTHFSPTLQSSAFNMGNGAKAQQKRERAADKTKKGPTSQLKSVSHNYQHARDFTV